MARLGGIAVLTALVLGIFSCGAQQVAPAPTAQPTPAPLAPTSTAQASAHVDPTNESPALPPRDISRWRLAVEGYVPSVKREKVIPLDGRRVRFAEYLNQVHQRIHAIFADQFLTSLDVLSDSDVMNRAKPKVMLEIVVESQEGRIHRMGVIAPSGVTAFDVATLDSVDQAQPFGPPPRAIVSPDGFVYFHWEFHRGAEACGTWNARPFLLGSAPNAARTAP